jgi:hypothetical protein
MLGKSSVGGAPVDQFLLIPFGYVEVDRAAAGGSFTFTREMAAQAVAAFVAGGRRLAIDYEHQTIGGEFNRRADQLAPAAGWIGKLEVRTDGLWATAVEWTARARELIGSGEYAYFSPVIDWTDETRTAVQALGPVALTNDPAMRGVPRLAATGQNRRTSMVTTIMQAKPLPFVGTLDRAGVEGEQPRFSPEDERRIEEAGLVLAAALEKVAELVNVNNWSLGEVDRVFDHLSKDDMSLFRLLAQAVDEKRKQQTGEELIQQVQTRAPDRAALIAVARRTYAAEATDPTKLTICSEKAWVNVALRDAGQQPLTGRELVEHGVSESDAANSIQRGRRALFAAGSVGGAGTKDRAYIVASAKAEFATWASDPRKRVLCDELGHVNVCLRDAGQVRLTRDEIIRHDVGSGRDPGGVWGRAFDASPALQAEFGSKGAFVAFKRAESLGLVNIVGRQSATPGPRPAVSGAAGSAKALEAAWRAAYSADPKLREEFTSVEAFVAFKRHETAGHVQILQRQRSQGV